jgi:hypothetical protein
MTSAADWTRERVRMMHEPTRKRDWAAILIYWGIKIAIVSLVCFVAGWFARVSIEAWKVDISKLVANGLFERASWYDGVRIVDVLLAVVLVVSGCVVIVEKKDQIVTWWDEIKRRAVGP